MTKSKSAKSKKPSLKALLIIFIFLLPILVSGVFVLTSFINSQANFDSIKIVYEAGRFGQNNTETNLFDVDSAGVNVQVTDSQTLILPGTKFSENITSVNLSGESKLDDETFYFEDSGESGYADDWAYSFTGWKIKDAELKIPGKTIFQPGDVILTETLQQYVSSDSLTLEAVWGKCYFICNPYENMEYTLQSEIAADETKLLYVFNAAASASASGVDVTAVKSSDSYTGNNPNLPKSTIDALYESIRLELGVDESLSTSNSSAYDAAIKNAQGNELTFDAFSRVVMLVDDLDYYSDTNQRLAKYYGYSNVPHAGGTTKDSKHYGVYVSATYKSLGGTAFDYNYKPKGYSNTLYGNFRFDNINFNLAAKTVFGGQTSGAEFMLSHIQPSDYSYNDFASGATSQSYLEFTARYNATISGTPAISTLRPNDATYMVVNGGKFGGIQNQYSTSITSGKKLYWTFGRKINVTGAITCGTTSAYEENVINLYYNYNVNILGGQIQEFYGGSNGMNTISAGERNINLFGDASGNKEYDPNVKYLYGGAAQARLFVKNDIKITAKNCTLLGNMYGGGRDFSATTYGDIRVSLTNCKLSGDLFGGGQYANCESTPSKYVQYSVVNKHIIGTDTDIAYLMEKLDGSNNYTSSVDTSWVAVGYGGDVYLELDNTQVKGDVYGSGMGNTQIVNASTQYSIISDWKNGQIYPSDEGDWLTTPISDYPSYNINTGRICVYAYRDGTYTENSPDTMSYYTKRSYASLSLATVENVDIKILNKSKIGTSGGKGNVYGGGAIAQVKEHTKVYIKDSTVYGNVYGGGDGVTLAGTVNVYFPEDGTAANGTYVAPKYTATQNGSSWTVTWTKQSPEQKNKTAVVYNWSNETYLLNEPYNGIDHENKLLYAPTNQAQRGSVLGNTTVTIDGDSTIYKNIYGGGNHGVVYGNTSVKIDNGKCLGQVFGGGNGDATQNETDVLGKVQGNASLTISGGTINESYGGSNAANVNGSTNLVINGGTVAYAFGGNNVKGEISMAINVTLSNGTITNQLFGGGNKADYNDITNLTISGGKVGDVNTTPSPGNPVVGSAYGGGKIAKVAGTNVEVSGGEIRSLFGGSLSADVNGSITVKITGGTIVTFLGGNDQSGSVNGDIKIKVGKDDFTGSNNDITITNFFGGGNAAHYNYGSSWQPSGNESDYNFAIPDPNFKGVTIDIYNGKIYQAFGGGVLAFTTNVRLYVYGGAFNFIYGGGYEADAVYTVIHMFGGSVNGDMLPENLNGPPQENHGGYIFGGGYDGDVMSASVRLEKNNVGTVQSLKIYHSIFGGGNMADVCQTNVIVEKGEVVGSIYGGGFRGETGTVQSKHNFNVPNNFRYGSYVFISGGEIGTGEEGSSTRYIGNVYGGGYLGQTNETHVDIASIAKDANIPFSLGGNVYGGGHNANISTNTYVHMLTGTVGGSVYGGGRNGNVQGTSHVDILSGTVSGNVYGGGLYGTCTNTKVLITDKKNVIKSVNENILEKLEEELNVYNLLVQIEGNVFGGGKGHTATVYDSTRVIIDCLFDFTANENITTTANIVQSGKIDTTLNYSESQSYIRNSVYGGGDLGMVGVGDIDSINNVADISRVGTTSVTIRSGHVMGSVFGGGSGVPGAGEIYNVYMGAVFGNTTTSVLRGYIGHNVYGGGKTSRVYGAPTFATQVIVDETVAVKEYDENNVEVDRYGNIALGGSVFAGGDRGNSVTQNASIPTTIGDVSVTITAQENSSIYFMSGGIYGDGNYCLVNGNRTIQITNLTVGNTGPNGEKMLKTFYSLQRADLVKLYNTEIVLLGAVDLVDEEADATLFSINRVDSIQMEAGSTIKLDQVVNLLGEIVSDVYTDRKFINNGFNGINGHNVTTDIEVLTQQEINDYRESSQDKNLICVANGLFLEIIEESGAYGKVKGLFTLQLLFANPGEGGGFVYADIARSTGDFICETRYLNGENYMDVVDDVGGFTNNVPKYYFWYISGSKILYTSSVIGYIGFDKTDFQEDRMIPKHDANLYYALSTISANSTLLNAISEGGEYELVQRGDNLINQQIAVEFKIGDISVGFLVYEGNAWGIKKGNNDVIFGYGTETTQRQNNLLTEAIALNGQNNNFSVILHKALSVNAEMREMMVHLSIDLLVDEENNKFNINTAGASTLIFDVMLNIVRLVPTQDSFNSAGFNYVGSYVDNKQIQITGDSSLTADIRTKYIPGAFPITDSAKLSWQLSTVGYTYYMDNTLGTYLTLDSKGNLVNISKNLIYNKSSLNETDNELVIYRKDNQVDVLASSYYYKTSGVNGQEEIELVAITNIGSAAWSFPKNTKIIMVDRTLETSSKAYYYICNDVTSVIDLKDFMIIGTTNKIEYCTGDDTPTFIKEYLSGENKRKTERLVFIFDFSSVEWGNKTAFRGNIVLQHLYGGVDFMDFVASGVASQTGTGYSRSAPTVTAFQLDPSKDGLNEVSWQVTVGADEGKEKKDENGNEYFYGKDNYTITVNFDEDNDWINTKLEEGEYSMLIELVDQNKNLVNIPVGMHFKYKGVDYYPGADREYAVIPVLATGKHEIIAENTIYELPANVKFRITVFSSPDTKYYNALSTTLSKEATFVIVPNPEYSIKISVDDKPVLESGDELKLTIDMSKSTDYGETSATVVLEQRVGDTYQSVEWTALFATTKPDTLTSGNVVWQVSQTAQSGSYRLVFKYDKHIEYFYLIKN